MRAAQPIIDSLSSRAYSPSLTRTCANPPSRNYHKLGNVEAMFSIINVEAMFSMI